MSLLPRLVAVSAFALPVGASGQDAPEAQHLAEIVAKAVEQDAPDFAAFLDGLTEDDAPGITPARDAMVAGNLEPRQIDLLARLLGAYNRAKNEHAALDLLSELIALETYASPDYPEQYNNPVFIEFGEKIEAVATEFGMEFRNVDGRIFEVTLDGPTDEVFGVLTHADVVPVQSRTWTTDDGDVEPFVMQVIGNRIYGRGAIDDKGSIATALFAMGAAKISGLPLQRDVRLMIETTEETSGAGMEYYLENETAPAYNIVLDSDYPAVIAEKGYGTITASFPVIEAEGDAPVILAISGSAAANQIPEHATATIAASDPEALTRDLRTAAADYVSDNGGDFEISVEMADGAVAVDVAGASAHASEPESGVNPVPRLTGFLGASGVAFVPNHYAQAVNYVNEAYGLDYLGENLGVGYSDDFMGPLTLSPTFFAEKDGALLMAVNVRAPRNADTDVAGVQEQIVHALSSWKDGAGSPASFEVELNDWMARDPSGAWLNLLLGIYGDTTGEPAVPVSSAGSTTAKLLPNAVNFGPNMPTDKYMGHTENEFKRLDVFGLDLQMFTEMMVRMSNLPSLE